MRPDIELYNEALDSGKEGAWADVVLLLRKALQINDSEAEYYSLMGVAYLGLELKDLAIYNFRQANKLNPYDPLLAHYLPFLNDDDNPPFADDIPHSPKPITPNIAAETEPDNGESQFP
jgi:tetratricopeptide (TPR) repeat protein